ncbi:MAG: hypothetical protein K8F36_14725 [Melioribacteraceae bacterium]|nr:hypothetical protein [Melioribacteraceae bacterium]
MDKETKNKVKDMLYENAINNLNWNNSKNFFTGFLASKEIVKIAEFKGVLDSENDCIYLIPVVKPFIPFLFNTYETEEKKDYAKNAVLIEELTSYLNDYLKILNDNSVNESKLFDKRKSKKKAEDYIEEFLQSVNFDKSLNNSELAPIIISWCKENEYPSYSEKTIRPKISKFRNLSE